MRPSESQPVKAALYMVGAIFSFTAMAISGREMAASLDTFEIMFFRSLIGIIIILGLGFAFGTLSQIKTNRLGLHLLRNISHFTGQNLWFFALIYIPFSQLFALEFSAPLWIAVLAALFLQERLTRVRLMSLAIGFFGILIISRPDAHSLSPALIAGALSAIAFAGSIICTKKLIRDQSTTCILFWLVLMQAVMGLICAGIDFDITLPTGIHIVYVTVVGCCGLLAHFCITRALSLAPAIVVAPLEFLRLPLISVIGFALYDESLNWGILFGAVLIFGANIMNMWAERPVKLKTG